MTPQVPPESTANPLVTTLMSARLLLLILLVLIAGWFLWRQRLLAVALAVIAGLLGIALLVRLHELLVLIVIAAVLAFILDRPTQRLERHMPRAAAILIVYLVLVGSLVLGGALLVPRLVTQAQKLTAEVPTYAEMIRGHSQRFLAWYEDTPPAFHSAVDQMLEAARTHSQELLTGAGKVLIGMVGWFVKGILILVISIYMLTDKRRLRDWVFKWTPDRYHHDVLETMEEIGAALGGYLRAQVVVILFVAVTVTLVLTLFGIPHALFIGLAAGVLEVIPYFGAFAGAIPAVILSMSKSWFHMLGVIAAFIAINQVEGHVVIPLVVGKHLEMRPLVILLSLLAGHLLWGVAGMIIAVPTVSVLGIIIPRLVKLYKELRAHEKASAAARETKAE